MRIVIDMQGAQTESRFRGIGRYTLSLAQSIVRNRGEHEIILVLSSLFPDTIEPIRQAFDGLMLEKNILVWHAHGPLRECEPGNTWRRETAELIREAFILGLKPDLVHMSSLFEGYVDDAVNSIGRFDTTPVSVSLYDLIPLLNPAQYLDTNPAYAKYYRRKIDHLRRSSLMLAISESSRQEGLAQLHIADNKVVNISTAADAHFHPMPVSAERELYLQKKFGIARPFLLYTGGADERKNLPRLIKAYACLSSSLRDTHQLVFAGKMPKGDVQKFKAEANSAGLRADELSFTGYISDEELVQLYNLCELFVLPSWHEGFGLPALEAMSCGAAVIGANTSSVPEVIGFEKGLFNPYLPESISQKISQTLTDNAFRAKLIEHGKIQATKFSWDETAQRAISAFERFQVKNPHLVDDWASIYKKEKQSYHKLINAIATLSQKPPILPELDLAGCAAAIARNIETIKRFHRVAVLPDCISWRIEGPFDSSYSLALINREIAIALEALGHNVALYSTEGPGDFSPNPHFLHKHPRIAMLYERSKVMMHDAAHVVSRNLYPPRVSDMQSRLNLLHNYAWEESGFPQEWVEQFNQYLQGITCVSRHVKKIMIDNGLTIPQSVSGNGVDHYERIEADTTYQVTGRAFRFLHISSCFPRKGADVLLNAYGRAFNASDEVSLIIKTFKNPHNEIHCWLAKARAEKSNYPDVQIIEEELTDGQLKSLYMQCQALVAPSRAEGFGLPLAEAMLTGLPVITTGWSGQLDFCNDETAWLLDYRFEPACTHFDLFDSVWAEPDVSGLAEKMSEIYRMPPGERHLKPSAGRKLLLENFCWKHVAERLVNSARAWSKCIKVREPRIGWITSWNTRCGIAAYSEHLIKNIPVQVKVLASKTASLTGIDEKNVVRCWDSGEHEHLTHLKQEIEQLQIDTLVVQFNYGFFNFEQFGMFLQEQVKSGRIVIVMMHATSDPSHAPHKKLSMLAPALANCHRVLVHAPGDLNRLKALGLIENVAIFPHGVLDYQTAPNKKKPSTAFRLASYGFFLPHKGLLELIDAVSLLHKHGINITLSMINSEYPSPDSRRLIEQSLKKIRKYNLGKWIDVCTDYLPDEECLNQLGKADLIIFPYQNTGESSSAAVRYGLASGRPVAVTPLSIFDDVKQAVYFLPGQSAEDIAEGLSKLIKDFASKEDYILKKKSVAERWRAAHRFSRVGTRLYGMIMALINNKDHNHP